MGLGRMLVSPGGLLVAFVVFTLLMMLRGNAVRPCSILVMFSSSRVGFLRHFLLQFDEVAKEKHLNRAEVSAVSQIAKPQGTDAVSKNVLVLIWNHSFFVIGLQEDLDDLAAFA